MGELRKWVNDSKTDKGMGDSVKLTVLFITIGIISLMSAIVLISKVTLSNGTLLENWVYVGLAILNINIINRMILVVMRIIYLETNLIDAYGTEVMYGLNIIYKITNGSFYLLLIYVVINKI